MAKSTKTKKQTSSSEVISSNNKKSSPQILGIIAIFLASFTIASFFSGAMGLFGSYLEKITLFFTGGGRYLLPVILLLLGIQLINKGKIFLNARNLGMILFFATFCFYLHSYLPFKEINPWNSIFSYILEDGVKGLGGGIIGGIGFYLLTLFFGKIGFYIIEIFFIIISLVLITGSTLGQLGKNTASKSKTMGGRIKKFIMNFLFEEVEINPKKKPENSKKIASKAVKAKDAEQELKERLPLIFNYNEVRNSEDFLKEVNKDKVIKKKVKLDTLEKIPMEEKRENLDKVEDISLRDKNCNDYKLPPSSLLVYQDNSNVASSEEEITTKTYILEKTLKDFGISAKVTEVSIGPAITRYEIHPPAGVKVSRIVGLSDDLALSLASPGIRIEAPIPGKAAVGIEVPNSEISPVTLRELIESKPFIAATSKLTVVLGKDITGNPITTDLGKMPHLLVAGATGSGKSVCINTLISSILFRANPEEVKFLMIDPKMVELTNYNGIPHLISPVVTDAKKSAGTLRWAVMEMEKRYNLFAKEGVKEITRYNKLAFSSLDPEKKPLPFIIIIIDELADLMMVAPSDVEDSICRLAQMARAAGIHLVVATQRPSVDVITGLIKANIPSRISFAVSSQMDSRTILDMGGAEKLLGKGDMLFFPLGSSKPIRVQGAFLSDQEVEGLVEFIKKQGEPTYDEEVLKAPSIKGEKASADNLEDELLPRAIQIFIENKTASISLLQRRLHIGYARAARLVDIMEQRGIVGGFEGSKPRNILMSMEEFQKTFPQDMT